MSQDDGETIICEEAIEHTVRRLLSMPLSRTGTVRRLNRRPVTPWRFWVRPGRISAWWGNFVIENQIVVPEEWRENFRVSRDCLYSLARELRSCTC